MKKKTKVIIALCFAFGATLALAACATEQNPYEDFDRNGYTVSVRFDANGGKFAALDRVEIVDVFSPAEMQEGADGNKQFRPLQPGSSQRGDGEAVTEVSNDGHFLAGWYTERTPRVNAAGEALDEYGELCSVTGRAQGYEYSGLWDFENDWYSVDPDAEYTSAEPVLTLYAGWIPYFSYTFYEPVYAADGTTVTAWTEVGETTFDPSFSDGSLKLPAWNEETGALDMNDFPSVQGKTFTAVYADEALSQELTQVTHTGTIDYEKGIATGHDEPLYTTWREGTWFRIRTAEQFSRNGRIDGSYEILSDLDFTDVTWPAGLSRGIYSGTIEGNGHTFSNIKVTQTSVTDTRGGLFGNIAASASIKDVTFENVTYTLSAGTRMAGAQFGLFTGNLSADAEIENVAVSGTFEVGGNIFPELDRYKNVGLIVGGGDDHGISADNVGCKALSVETDEDGDGINETTSWPYRVAADADGFIIISANEDPSRDPNG